jgi:hypothetical protein
MPVPRDQLAFRVFVASPGDMVNERQILADVIEEVNFIWPETFGVRLELIRWETHAMPGIGEDGQDVINEQIGDDYDIFIGILGVRFGTPTHRAESGTQEEFQRAFARFKADPSSVRIMMYFSEVPVNPRQIDVEQLRKVNEFQIEIQNDGVLTYSFDSSSRLAMLLRLHLTRQINAWRDGKWGAPRIIENVADGATHQEGDPSDL